MTPYYNAVVHYSGGLMSFGAAKLACERFGPENVCLLFADTGAESDDSYRFIVQTASYLGAHLEIVRRMSKHSRTYIRAWDMFEERKLIASNRVGICTEHLKREPLNNWIAAHAPNAVNVIGFSIEESERIERLKKARPQVTWYFPLAEKPYTDVCTILSWLKEANIEMPSAYRKGMNHNNCNGGCFKAGIGHWARLLEVAPEVFAYHERREQEFQKKTGRSYTILKRSCRSSEKGWRHYPLSELRADYKAGRIKASSFRLPCACGVLFSDEEEPAPVEDESDIFGAAP